MIGIVVAAGLISACRSSPDLASDPTSTGSSITGPTGSVPVTDPPMVAESPATDPPRPIANLPATIARDCSVNVAPALNQWIASVPDGATLKLGGGCFRVDQTVDVQGRRDLVLDGAGATFDGSHVTGDASTIATPSKDAKMRVHLRIVESVGITIDDLTIIGALPEADSPGIYNPALEGQHGVSLLSSQDVTIRNSRITRVYGDFIYFGRSGATGFSGGHVHDNVLDRNGRQGIAVTAGHDITIERNDIRNVGRSTFDLEPNGAFWGASRVRIRDNKVGAGKLSFVAISGGGPVEDVEISGNVLEGRPMIVFIGGSDYRPKSIRLVENRSDTQFGSSHAVALIRVFRADDVEVRGNHQPLQEGRGNFGVQAVDTTDLSVERNTFVDAAGSYTTDGNEDGVTACGNRFASDAPLDQPKPCPPSGDP